MYKYLIFSAFYAFLFFTILSAQEDIIVDSDDYGDRLKIGYVWQGNISFNPLISNYEYDKEFMRLVYGEGLFSENNEGQIVHNLALKSKEQEPTVIRIELRPNLKFHDGSLVTAEDVKFTYELYKKFSLQSPLHFNARLINSFEIYGSDVIRFKLVKPIPGFYETIGKLPILPKNICKIWLKYNFLSELENIKPIGSGYFKFIEHKHNLSLRLDSFDKHFLGKSYISGIDFLFFETQDRLLEAFLREEVDLIQINDKSEIQKTLQFSKKIVELDTEERILYYINLNTRELPFRDRVIRNALNYAINKEQIVANISENNAFSKFTNLTTNQSDNYNYFTPHAYKPLTALETLLNGRFIKNSLGKLIRDKKELQFELYIQKGSLFEESIARLIAINLGDIGINVIPLFIEASELNNKIAQGNYHAVLRKFTYNPRRVNETLRDFYFNELNIQDGFKNYKDGRIEFYLDLAAKSTEFSDTKTLSIRFLKQIKGYSPCIFLFFKDTDIYTINPRFENILSTKTINNGKVVNHFKPKNEWFVKKDNHKYKRVPE